MALETIDGLFEGPALKGAVFFPCPRAEIGRQAGLRDQCQKWRTGSSPVVGIRFSGL
jgi:hypothetical protein